MSEREDLTLELNELRAALLARDEEENQDPVWSSQDAGDNSFLRLATSIDIDQVLQSVGNRVNQLKSELATATLALTPAPNVGGQVTPLGPSPIDSLETIGALKTELERCADDLVSTGSLAKFEHDELQSRQGREMKLKRLEVLVDALEKLAKYQSEIDVFDRELDQGNVDKAAASVLIIEELCGAMAKVATSSSSTKSNSQANNASSLAASRVAKAARTQYRNRRAALQARLDECLFDAIRYDSEKKAIIVSLDTRSERLRGSVRLEKVMEALHTLNGLVTRLQERLARPLVNNLISEVVKDPIRFRLEEDVSQPSMPVLRLVENSGKQNVQTVAPLAALDSVQLALRFVWGEVLNRDNDLQAQLNVYGMIEGSLKSILREAVPNTFAELESFARDTLDRTSKFDQEMERIGCKATEKLAGFVSDAESNFARKLREKVAENVRISAKHDLASFERVDAETEPEFLLGKNQFAIAPEMKISKFARQVVRIAENSLREASNIESQTCRLALIKAARSCFELFRALAGPLRRDEMLVNARYAMVHRNDCEYLGHHLTIISHRFRHQIGLKEVVMVDLAPYLFVEADETFKRETELRCRQLQDMFKSDKDTSQIDFGGVLAKSDAIFKSWSEVLPSRLVEMVKHEIGEALANGVFNVICSGEVNVVSLNDRRVLMKKLTSFAEAVKSRGGSSKRTEQMYKALQPHMSLFPLFADMVDAELQDWPPESLVAFAYAVFGETATKDELKRFEEKILFY